MADLSASTRLKANVVTLPGVLMQSVTAIAPAIAGMFTMPFIVLNAGVAAPMAFVGAFVIALLVGYVLAQFTRHLSSTGSYYTFVSRSLGGRAGFLVAWVYLLFYPVVIAQVGSFMGSTLQSTLKAEYNITFEWWWFMVFLIVFVAYTAWRGIELSVKLLIALGLIEGLIVLVLGLWGLASPGAGGTTLSWVSAGFKGGNLHGLFLGVVFAIFALTGWDGAAPLAEESRDPKRTVPRAVMGSILIMGVFLIVVSWGQTSGWGTSHIASFAGSSQLPAFVLGQRYWGDAWVIILFALFNSAIAVSIACMNASARFLYGMSRARALPRELTKLHPVHGTPTNAIWVQTGINVVLGLLLPLVIGVANVYNVTGTWFTFALAFVYIVASYRPVPLLPAAAPRRVQLDQARRHPVPRFGRADRGRLLLGEPAAGLAGLAGAVHRARLAGRRLRRAGLRLPWRPRPQPGPGRPGHGRDPRDHGGGRSPPQVRSRVGPGELISLWPT